MEEHLDFLIDAPEDDRGGIRIPWSVFVSLILHAVVITWIVKNYRPIQASELPSSPIVHYVELMRQQPKDFTEAPGPKTATASLAAPMSDANRKASMPKPTGEPPPSRPGDGTPIYVPHNAAGDGRRPQPASPPIQQAPPTPAPSQQAAAQASALTQELMQHSPNSQQVASSQQVQPYRGTQANGGTPNLRQAIREVSRVASLGGGGGQGPDLGNAGGEEGYAAECPLFFETQWYDWCEYAEWVVHLLRGEWDSNMPMPLRQTCRTGVVRSRFT